jgi:hypothetical protein
MAEFSQVSVSPSNVEDENDSNVEEADETYNDSDASSTGDTEMPAAAAASLKPPEFFNKTLSSDFTVFIGDEILDIDKLPIKKSFLQKYVNTDPNTILLSWFNTTYVPEVYLKVKLLFKYIKPLMEDVVNYPGSPITAQVPLVPGIIVAKNELITVCTVGGVFFQDSVDALDQNFFDTSSVYYLKPAQQLPYAISSKTNCNFIDDTPLAPEGILNVSLNVSYYEKLLMVVASVNWYFEQKNDFVISLESDNSLYKRNFKASVKETPLKNNIRTKLVEILNVLHEDNITNSLLHNWLFVQMLYKFVTYAATVFVVKSTSQAHQSLLNNILHLCNSLNFEDYIGTLRVWTGDSGFQEFRFPAEVEDEEVVSFNFVFKYLYEYFEPVQAAGKKKAPKKRSSLEEVFLSLEGNTPSKKGRGQKRARADESKTESKTESKAEASEASVPLEKRTPVFSSGDTLWIRDCGAKGCKTKISFGYPYCKKHTLKYYKLKTNCYFNEENERGDVENWYEDGVFAFDEAKGDQPVFTPGTTIVGYIGEVLTLVEMKERYNYFEAAPRARLKPNLNYKPYNIQIYAPESEGEHPNWLDGSYLRGLAFMIRHSDDPNVETQYNESLEEWHVVAIKPIFHNEELFIKHGNFETRDNVRFVTTAVDLEEVGGSSEEEEFWDIESEKAENLELSTLSSLILKETQIQAFIATYDDENMEKRRKEKSMEDLENDLRDVREQQRIIIERHKNELEINKLTGKHVLLELLQSYAKQRMKVMQKDEIRAKATVNSVRYFERFIRDMLNDENVKQDLELKKTIENDLRIVTTFLEKHPIEQEPKPAPESKTSGKAVQRKKRRIGKQ